MLVIGIITIGLIISRYPAATTAGYTYSYGNNINGGTLGATAYNADYSGAPTSSFLNLGSRQPYQPVINRSYYPEYYYGTSATTYTQPSTKSYYYYYYNTPGTTTTTTSYNDGYYGTDQGYVPAGCENGTDYSTTTNEPCG